MSELCRELRVHFLDKYDRDQAQNTLLELREIDYGDEEVLGQDFALFDRIVTFFYRLKEQSSTLKDFFHSLEMPQTRAAGLGAVIPKADFVQCLRDIEQAADKISEFKTLCEKLARPNETLYKKIEQILKTGTVELEKDRLGLR